MAEQESSKKKSQWQERSERPVATRPMNSAQIEEFRRHLVASYKCDATDITYDFEKIFDENDEDRDDCLWLKYKMKTIWHGKPTDRVIYTIKLPIPDELRMMAEQLKRQGAKMQRTRRAPGAKLALPAPGDAPSVVTYTQPPQYTPPIEEIDETPSSEPVVEVPTIVRPKLKKPVRKPKV
jgi:hypothetical protein